MHCTTALHCTEHGSTTSTATPSENLSFYLLPTVPDPPLLSYPALRTPPWIGREREALEALAFLSKGVLYSYVQPDRFLSTAMLLLLLLLDYNNNNSSVFLWCRPQYPAIPFYIKHTHTRKTRQETHTHTHTYLATQRMHYHCIDCRRLFGKSPI